MNRFVKNEKKQKQRRASFFSAGFSLLMLLALYFGIRYISENTIAKQQESLETALQRCVVQCYAVEGTYPPSLAYLQEHYGLTYDEDLFFVDYTIVGSNLLPDITIIRKD